MTKTARHAAERTVSPEPPVSKALRDRIEADAEQVAHTLNPDRQPGTVLYPDPQAPRSRDAAPAPQSNAEIQMARRTDAGPRAVASDWISADVSTLTLWGAGAAGLLLVMAMLAGIA